MTGLGASLLALGLVGMAEWGEDDPLSSPSHNPAAIRKAKKDRARQLSIARQQEIMNGIGKPPKKKHKKKK